MRRAALLALLLVAALPASALGATGLGQPRAPRSLTTAPPGFELTGRQAIAQARATAKVRAIRVPGRRLRAKAFLFGADYWLVEFYAGREHRAEVEINGRSGRLKYAIAGRELAWPPLARGERGPYARGTHKLLLLAGLLFLLPFVDLRRPLRLLHLDLLVILSLGVSFALAERGAVYASTPLRYPPFIYLAWRLARLALGPRPRAGGRLTWMPAWLLASALAVLLAVRYGLDLRYGAVNDIGYDSLYGADSIIHGYPLYQASSHLGSYGPALYLLYVPFNLIVGFDLSQAHTDAARVAAIVWDAGTVATLIALGRRLRPGPSGTQLGLALGFAWAACPWSCFVLTQNTNDGLVALLLSLTLLVASSPVARGAVLGTAAAAKFAPLALAGLFLRVGAERGRAPALRYALTLVVVVVALIGAYAAGPGLPAFWHLTLGYELHRSAPFSLWGLYPALAPLHLVVTAFALVVIALTLVLPRERTLPRIAAAGGAVLVVVELTSTYWYFFYLAWFLPYALIALLTAAD